MIKKLLAAVSVCFLMFAGATTATASERVAMEYDTTYRLYFNIGDDVPEADFESFIDTVIADNLKQGYTVVEGEGYSFRHGTKFSNVTYIVIVDCKKSAESEATRKVVIDEFIKQFGRFGGTVYSTETPLSAVAAYQ